MFLRKKGVAVMKNILRLLVIGIVLSGCSFGWGPEDGDIPRPNVVYDGGGFVEPSIGGAPSNGYTVIEPGQATTLHSVEFASYGDTGFNGILLPGKPNEQFANVSITLENLFSSDRDVDFGYVVVHHQDHRWTTSHAEPAQNGQRPYAYRMRAYARYTAQISFPIPDVIDATVWWVATDSTMFYLGTIE